MFLVCSIIFQLLTEFFGLAFIVPQNQLFCFQSLLQCVP